MQSASIKTGFFSRAPIDWNYIFDLVLGQLAEIPVSQSCRLWALPSSYQEKI